MENLKVKHPWAQVLCTRTSPKWEKTGHIQATQLTGGKTRIHRYNLSGRLENTADKRAYSFDLCVCRERRLLAPRHGQPTYVGGLEYTGVKRIGYMNAMSAYIYVIYAYTTWAE